MEKKQSTKKQTEKKGLQEKAIMGCKVKISEEEGQQQLLLDGRPVEFHKTNAGYILKANVYAEPQETLADAVTLYLQTQAK